MSYYGKSEWDDVLYEIKEFLKTHTIYELLSIVSTAVEYKEKDYTE